MRHWLALGIALAAGFVGYGELKSDVKGHDKRIENVESDIRSRANGDVQLVQRLATIEAQIKFLVEAEVSRQQRAGQR